MPYKDRLKQNRYLAEYKNKLYAVRRLEWIEQNGPCKHCSSWENLEIDYINRLTKEFEIGGIWGRTKEIRDRELSKCQALCHFCHVIKTNRELYSPRQHGTMTMYQAGKCRCSECRQVNTDTCRKRQQRLRSN